MNAAAASFPVPYAAPERQSWRLIASGLAHNALAGFPPRAFEEMAVHRSFVGRQQVILSEPAGIRHVLIENAENYRRTPAMYRLLGPVVGDGLFLADGEDWRAQRRAAAPAFAPRTMPAVAGHVGQAADRLVGELTAARAGAGIDLFARLQLLALEVAAAALFSIDITAEGPALRRELQAYAEGLGRPGLLDFMLPRWLPAPRALARRRFRRRWMARIGDTLAARRAAPPADPPDLYDLMAAAAPDPRQLVEQSATMLAAGHETTSVALFWSVYLAASLPEVQERIAAEAKGLDLGPAGAAAALPALCYTRAVVDEALRLYPPAFSIVRQAKAADSAGGVPIPKRAAVLIVPWVLHRHRRLWRDPDRFDPGRFLPGDANGAEPPPRFAYLPFGAGPRACIGAQFALTETVLVLARLVQAFRLERADRTPVQPLARITLQPDRSPPFRLSPR